jgi:hypothetical protein
VPPKPVNYPDLQKEQVMSSGAFALYVDQQAGGGPNAPIDRIVPLPHLGGDNGIDFDRRRLTLSYDNLPAGAPNSVHVTGRFLGGGGAQIDLTIQAGECHVVDAPREACAAALRVDPAPAGSVRGPLSALVEYSS